MLTSDSASEQTQKTAAYYSSSLLAFPRSPEMATGDAIMGSLYRALGLASIGEKDVAHLGVSFKKDVDAGTNAPAVGLPPETWRFVVKEGPLRSPETKQQRNRKLLHMNPVVPDVALYSASSVARVGGNPWNPGEYIRGMIARGASTTADATAVWAELFQALRVGLAQGDPLRDDVWAVVLEREFAARRPSAHPPANAPTPDPRHGMGERAVGLTGNFPARQFVRDLRNALGLRSRLTRQQWISVLDSLLRVATVADALWVCRANDVVYHECLRVLEGSEVPDRFVLDERLAPGRYDFLQLGEPVERRLREHCRLYAKARLGLNYILNKVGLDSSGPYSADGFVEFLRIVRGKRESLPSNEVESFVRSKCEENPELLRIKGSGTFTANLYFFCRHVLGQRMTVEQVQRHYDQGYWCRKSGPYRSAQWLVELGPVAALSMVHCCCMSLGRDGQERSVTLNDFASHLSAYGIDTSAAAKLAAGSLGALLRALGVALDSPDAEGGMVLVDSLTM